MAIANQLILTKDQIQMVVLISIVFVALFVGTYLILFSPDAEALNNLSNKKQELQKQISEKQKIANQLVPAKKDIELFNQKVVEYKKMLINPSEFDFFKDTLRDMGNEYNVKVNRDSTITVDDSTKTVFKEDLNYTEKEIYLDLSCKYHEFGSFLNRIENTSAFRKAKSFNMSKRGDAMSGMLSIDVKILSLLSENPL